MIDNDGGIPAGLEEAFVRNDHGASFGCTVRQALAPVLDLDQPKLGARRFSFTKWVPEGAKMFPEETGARADGKWKRRASRTLLLEPCRMQVVSRKLP